MFEDFFCNQAAKKPSVIFPTSFYFEQFDSNKKTCFTKKIATFFKK